jgi:hypothetical protein
MDFFLPIGMSKYKGGTDRGNCKKGGLIVPESKRGGQDRRKPAVPRTNPICIG